jgi:hypothetical protein
LEVDNAARLTKETEDALREMFIFYGEDPITAADPEATGEFLKIIATFLVQFEVRKFREAIYNGKKNILKYENTGTTSN